jgi:hypothetical protein
MTVSTEAFADRLLGATLQLVDVLAVYLGDRLGWYQALASGGPATPDELVARAGGSARYAREWLEQQAGTGMLTLEADGRFALPAGAAEVLTDPDSLNYLAPLASMFGAAATFAPPVTDTDRLMYGFCLFICLPDGMSTQPSAGTGTVMRAETLRRYAKEAGFSDIEVLPTGEFGFWRFYRLAHEHGTLAEIVTTARQQWSQTLGEATTAGQLCGSSAATTADPISKVTFRDSRTRCCAHTCPLILRTGLDRDSGSHPMTPGPDFVSVFDPQPRRVSARVARSEVRMRRGTSGDAVGVCRAGRVGVTR